MLAFVNSNFVDGHNVWVVQHRRRDSFALEALGDLGAGELSSQNHFQCDGAVETFLPRPVNHAHATACDFFQQLIITERTPQSGTVRRERDAADLRGMQARRRFVIDHPQQTSRTKSVQGIDGQDSATARAFWVLRHALPKFAVTPPFYGNPRPK
jgi:hypothetical protein